MPGMQFFFHTPSAPIAASSVALGYLKEGSDSVIETDNDYFNVFFAP
jgi:hypothetical protein